VCPDRTDRDIPAENFPGRGNGTMTERKYSVLIIAGGFPGNFSSASNINKLISIFTALSCEVCLLSPCDEDFIRLQKKDIYTIRKFPEGYEEFVKNQFLELKSIREIFRKRRIDLVFFAFGQDLKVIPLLFSRIMGKKIILRSDGRPSRVYEKYFRGQSAAKLFFFTLMETISYHTVDLLTSESEYLLKENSQDRPGKCGVANLPVDTDLFRQMTPFDERTYELGYFGQLQRTKGIMNLVEAVSGLVKANSSISLVIGGSGDQKEDIIRFVRNNNLEQNIHVIDWIPYEQFPRYLNTVKVFVFPSTLEGLPNTVLEAMACGTIVLSTPVGGIPGLITDGQNGFIMENNSVPCIAKNILRVLNTPDPEKAAGNAQVLIRQEYSVECTLRRYRDLLDMIYNRQSGKAG
jgi:glycosyltransferase involved in cell wall biosynthesis